MANKNDLHFWHMNVYGIKNCNTVKNALKWLDENKVEYTFHDYKTKGVTEKMLRSWCEQKGWESLVNKKGTTWRQLDTNVQKGTTDEDSAIRLMLEKPSIIKRPLIEDKGRVTALGFDETSYGEIFK